MSLRERLVFAEGWRRKPYKDSEGHLTIGCGHNLSVPISDLAIEQILTDDIRDAMASAQGAFPWLDDLDSARRGLIEEMVFIMGPSKVKRFKKMIAAVQAQDWDRAAHEMLASKWATQARARVKRLAEIMRTGVE